MSLGPFDIANNINKREPLLSPDEVKGSAFMLTRIYSNTRETVIVANEANQFGSWMPHDAVYRFLYHILPRNPRRFGKYHSRPKLEEDIKLIMEVYGYSRSKAEDAALAMGDITLDAFRDAMTKGGRRK